MRDLNALGAEQLLLQTDAVPGVADEIAVTADDAMTRNEDRHRIAAQRLRHRANGRGLAESARDPGVRRDRTVRDPARGGEHAPLEITSGEAKVGRPVEPASASGEVFRELALETEERSIESELEVLSSVDPRSGDSALVEILDPGDAELARRQEERADARREDDVSEDPRTHVRDP